MNVFILTADNITDCNGDLVESGYIVDVFTSYEAAIEEIENLTAKFKFRKDYDYSIEEFTVKDVS